MADIVRLHRTSILVVLGVLLVAVPTVFAVVPETGHWRLQERVLILFAWSLVAILGIVATVKADEDLHAEVTRTERRLVLRDHFKVALPKGAWGVPLQYDFTVYGPSQDARYLIPLYPPVLNGADLAIFAADAGAVGLAWSRMDGVVVITGQAVSDGRHGLTVAQQRRFSMFSVVAATAILDASGRKVGALAAIGRDDDGYFGTLEGVKAMRGLADSVAWMIPDALRWMLPTKADGEVAG